MQPALDEKAGQPAAPAYLQEQPQIDLIHCHRDKQGSQQAKPGKLVGKALPVAVLQRVIKGVVPLVEQHVQVHQPKAHAHNNADKANACHAVF